MNRVKRVVHATAAEVNGLSGKGVTAAVLDTGIALHPDLSGRIAGFADFVGGQKQPYDDSGHGTHVAGCLCGNGKCSNGLYAGIAPGCRLVVCKVLDERGDGNVAAMIEGIRYVLDTRRIYHTRILNISVGIGSIREAALEQELLSWIAKAWNAGCSSQWLPETTDLPRILSLRWVCRRTSYRSDVMMEGRPRDTKMPAPLIPGEVLQTAG